MELKPLPLRYAHAVIDREAWKDEAIRLQRRVEELREHNAVRTGDILRMLDALREERDDLRNRLELIETACTAHRVKRADWHAQAAEELARAEMSTAGHGDPSDGQRATGWGPLS